MTRPDPPAPLPSGGVPPGARPAPRRAIALRYDPASDAEGAPRVVASGGGEVADRLLALAREHGVPIREDRDLVELLARCDVGHEIPLELYAAVAEVLAFLYRANAQAAAARPGAAARTAPGPLPGPEPAQRPNS